MEEAVTATTSTIVTGQVTLGGQRDREELHGRTGSIEVFSTIKQAQAKHSSSSSSSSSMLISSSESHSSSLTSISTSSPTATNSQIVGSDLFISTATPKAVAQSQCDASSTGLAIPAEAPANNPLGGDHMCDEGAPLGEQQQQAPTTTAHIDIIADKPTLHRPISDEDLDKPEGSLKNRCERSNSCSQADLAATLSLQSAPSASLSHENLIGSSSLANSADHNIVTNLSHTITDSSSTGQLCQSTAAGSTTSQLDDPVASNHPDTIYNNNKSTTQSTFTSSTRFFSSKLNTGSLWSLLSVGSNNSSNHPAEMALNDDDCSTKAQQEPDKQAETSKSPISKQQSESASNNKVGFFSRASNQFKRQTQANFQDKEEKPKLISQENTQSGNPGVAISSNPDRSRVRFTLKYIGSAVLHKNFTLPMLEWIAKDIKRQTMKGAQSTSHRQFTIPTRDILLEIQSYQLTAISMKDGHPIFVHPMHCVSKYAQLQHDPTCFSYLIRDSKESPYFCHVFQAKSANKVHDIFSAIREATTRGNHISMMASANQQRPLVSGNNQAKQFNHPVQKSASMDGQFKSLLSSASKPVDNASAPTPSQPEIIKQSSMNPSQQPSSQFENSYQFEVLFVKRVKLQCRRVPASFVDDALETLKSFDVLKGDPKNQIKGMGKRIISASVDERQEYDESCQSPTPTDKSNQQGLAIDPNIVGPSASQRGSSMSLHAPSEVNTRKSNEAIREERETSRSCQHSPNKEIGLGLDRMATGAIDKTQEGLKKQHHQSMDCLMSIDCSIKSAREGNTPSYTNDFSPYNAITSSDLNERIAAIPVVSSSVSLGHETRQKLARQVRETIMATAANIKKGVYASGDKLDSSSSSKALDSLSCTAASSVPPVEASGNQLDMTPADDCPVIGTHLTDDKKPAHIDHLSDQRRSSAGPVGSAFSRYQNISVGSSASNNFDLFRRASARQVVKNRTMLLLIGKEELCTISIDKHQMLFSKSFTSIVHCLQGNNNKDHFGLICRDSGKINPNTESYAGFIFKCQSDKVVREIMSALKQVIYSSQHNYHGYNSPYNPLNAVATSQYGGAKTSTIAGLKSPQLERSRLIGQPASRLLGFDKGAATSSQQLHNVQQITPVVSLAAKRGFLNPIEVDEAARLSGKQNQQQTTAPVHPTQPTTAPTSSLFHTITGSHGSNNNQTNSQPKNLIKSMFCDNCPLYWYHRLCCDIESLSAEASKAIILRRIDSSVSEKEQDELFTKFSEFDIESVDEHNEIFMSLLRHQCERKQLKHNQTAAHLAAMTKSMAQASQQATSNSHIRDAGSRSQNQQHQRSGSSGGSLVSVLGSRPIDGLISNATSQQTTGQSIADASSAAIDSLKKAKNSISVSIENILKRRSSMRDELATGAQQSAASLSKTGSFKASSRESRASNIQAAEGRDATDQESPRNSSLLRSQSSSDHSQRSSAASWTDSLLGRAATAEMDQNPLVGLFRRRGSSFGSAAADEQANGSQEAGTRTSAECLSQVALNQQHSPAEQPASPSTSESRFMYARNPFSNSNGGASPSSMLSSAFWKKSIFDKIRQPSVGSLETTCLDTTNPNSARTNVLPFGPAEDENWQKKPKKRTREELRSLWRKAIVEQITLLKMEKQNQRLIDTEVEYDIQRIKLNYKDVTYNRDVTGSWNKLLKQDPTEKVEFREVARLVRIGVPKQRRGEIWMFLMNQYQLRHGTSFQPADSDYRGDANQTYRSLLSQLSVQQHEIFVDIGRTFPSHPYYSQYLSIGQLSLFNLLKAYSLLDPEVGYCQGLSFVAGILLLHVDSEDEAFELMRHLLFNFGLRKQYLPSMNALHLQLYQITRLLRDHEYDLFNHFDRHDISPSLYAAPWFLTLFASQFPLGFVARLLDLIFLIGIEAIFRVSLNLLAYHRASILNCTSIESSMDYMKNDLVNVESKSLVQIFDKSMTLDLRNKLIEYEIEYTFYCAEDKTRSGFGHSSSVEGYQSNFTPSSSTNISKSNDQSEPFMADNNVESTSVVADATATVIIQHLLSNIHLKSLKSNYSY